MARRRRPEQFSLLAALDAAPVYGAAAIAGPVAQAPVEPVRPGDMPMDRALIEAGLADRYSLSMEYALHDVTVPFNPRSIAFPVTIKRDRSGRRRLYLSTPACAGLPYVRRVEEITGLQAEWCPSQGACGQWRHAVDLADDGGWEQLAGSMEHTTENLVVSAVGLSVVWGRLLAANGRALLERLGVPMPGDVEEQVLAAWMPKHVRGPQAGSLSGWLAVHAVEIGWLTPQRKSGKRDVPASFTKAGLAAIASVRQS